MRRPPLLAFLGGLVATLSVPPFGWWPLGPVGVALLLVSVRGRESRERMLCGLTFGAALYGVSLWWAHEFTLPGWVAFAGVHAVWTSVAMVLVRPETPPWLTFPAAVVAAELARSTFPVGGLPLGGLDLGQAAGPLARIVTIGGRLALVGAVAVAAVALVAVVTRRGLVAVAATALVVLLALAGHLAPDGRATGSLRVAVVQGGGPRGLTALDDIPGRAYTAHAAAAAGVPTTGVDLVLWPEDVIDVRRFEGSPEAAQLAALARRTGAEVVAGVVEDAGPGRFFNRAYALDPQGRVTDRYDKVRRVPWGEYFPGRRFLERFATIPAREAVPGAGTGVLSTPSGTFGVLISYESFFAGRARGAAQEGASVLLVPTNASSFHTSQVPTQQLAAARLRALETGRALAQAGPTGLSGFVTAEGRVTARTDLGARQVLVGEVEQRSGATPHTRTGDWPALAVAAGALVAGRRRRRPD